MMPSDANRTPPMGGGALPHHHGASSNRKTLPESVIRSAISEDPVAVLTFFRSSSDRLWWREASTGRTIFHIAALTPRSNLMRELIQSHLTPYQLYSLNDVDYDGAHPLHLCVRAGHIEHVDLIIKVNTDDNGVFRLPFPAVDHRGRSVANVSRSRVTEWQGYSHDVVDAMTTPPPVVQASKMTLDDVLDILTLRRSFVETALPWSKLPAAAADTNTKDIASFDAVLTASLSNEPQGLAILTHTNKQHIYAAEMICINNDIQFDAKVFFLADSGMVSARSHTFTVDVYRCQEDKDVVLMAWGTLFAPDYTFFLCRRMANPKRQTAKTGDLTDWIAALLSLPVKAQAPPVATHHYPGGGGGSAPSPLNILSSPSNIGKLSSPETTDHTTTQPDPSLLLPSPFTALDLAGGSPLAAGAVSTHVPPTSPLIGSNREPSLESNDSLNASPTATFISVREAADMITHLMRICRRRTVQKSVFQALRQAAIIKKFINRLVEKRQRAVKAGVLRLEKLVKTVQLRRWLVEDQHEHFLDFEASAEDLYDSCRRSVHRKAYTWVVTMSEAIHHLAHYVTNNGDQFHYVVKALLHEMLHPTSSDQMELDEAAAKAARRIRRGPVEPHAPPSGNGGGGCLISPSGRLLSARREAPRGAPILQCTSRSPIPLLLGTRAQLRSLLLPHPN